MGKLSGSGVGCLRFFFFFFFFGVAYALSFVRDDGLYMTPGGNAYYALVFGPCVGLAPGGRFVYLFRPGGRFGAIPTKTPVFPHQFLVSCRLSFRQFFHVFMTILQSAVFFLKIFELVWTLSVLSRELMAWSHLLWISCGEWTFAGSFCQVIVLSHLIFQIVYIDSDTIILKSRFRPSSDLPFPFLKQ